MMAPVGVHADYDLDEDDFRCRECGSFLGDKDFCAECWFCEDCVTVCGVCGYSGIKSGGFPWWIFLIIAGVLLFGGGGVLLFFFLRKKKKDDGNDPPQGGNPIPGQPIEAQEPKPKE